MTAQHKHQSAKPSNAVVQPHAKATPGQRTATTTPLPRPQAVLQRAQADPTSLTAAEVDVLQRTIGLRAAQRMLGIPPPFAGPIQARLMVGSVGDQYEQEADQVAKQVVSDHTPPASLAQRAASDHTPAASLAQRAADEHKVQARPLVVSKIRRSTATPGIQRLFGRNMKKRIKENAYPNIEAIVAKAQSGRATEQELRKGLAKVERYKTAAAKMKGVEVAERMNTLRMLGDEIGLALDRISVGASRKQAKEIYLDQARSGGLKALETSTSYFKEGRGAGLEGEKYGLDQAESASLTTYSGNDYQYINPAAAFDEAWMDTQAKTHSLKGSEKDRFEEGSLHSAMMMEAMAKLPVWEGEGYRGERLTPAKFAEQYEEEGSTVTPRQATQVKAAFWSVSTDRSVAEGYAKEGATPDQTVSVLYFIAVGNARDLQAFSTSSQEDEVLCPAGSKVTVTRIEKKVKGEPGSPPATAWYHIYLNQT